MTMVFAPPSGGDIQDNTSSIQQLGLDSITLGQLRAMVSSAPKSKAGQRVSVCASVDDHMCSQQSFYDFRYDDEDTVMNEIDEFYSYVEMPQVAENLKAWQGTFPGGVFVSSTITRVHTILRICRVDESRNYRCTEKDSCRATLRKSRASRRRDPIHQCQTPLLRASRLISCKPVTGWFIYVMSQPGTFAETTSPEHQLHWIYENCKVVRSANGLNTIVESMKIASQKHDLLWYVSELIFLLFFVELAPARFQMQMRLTSKSLLQRRPTSWKSSLLRYQSISG